MVSVVAGVWEFATSGLEMSMVFLWLGASFLVLVRRRRPADRRAAGGGGVGLGTLIRPELVLGLRRVPGRPGRRWSTRPDGAGRGGRLRRAAVPWPPPWRVPVAYELFRMAYYALLVPSTALAKAAASSWWSQGATYLWNFVAPYTLWLPLPAGRPAGRDQGAQLVADG